MRNFVTLLIVFFALVYFSFSGLPEPEKNNEDWKFSGQIQLRPELDGRDFSNKTYPFSLTSIRTRLGVEKYLFNNVSFFFQLQDSRVFGEETIAASNKNMDLHQGYFKIDSLFNFPLELKAGRFEMAYSSGRILYSGQWSYLSRSFDGFLISYSAKPFKVDIFGITNTYSKSYIFQPSQDTALYPCPSQTDGGAGFFGFWSTLNFRNNNKLDIFSFYDFNGKKSDSVNNDLSRITSGVNYSLTEGNFSLNAELAGQFGDGNFASGKGWKYNYIVVNGVKIITDSVSFTKYSNKPILAYMAYIGAKYKFGDIAFSANLDVLSGTKTTETGRINLFYSDYASKHNFYGLMNYFNNPEKSTQSKGLNDYYFRTEYLPSGSKFGAQLDLHYFTTNMPLTLSNKQQSNSLGGEMDLVIKFSIYPKGTVEWGGSIFVPDNAMIDLYKTKANNQTVYRQDVSFWTYLMFRFGF